MPLIRQMKIRVTTKGGGVATQKSYKKNLPAGFAAAGPNQKDFTTRSLFVNKKIGPESDGVCGAAASQLGKY